MASTTNSLASMSLRSLGAMVNTVISTGRLSTPEGSSMELIPMELLRTELIRMELIRRALIRMVLSMVETSSTPVIRMADSNTVVIQAGKDQGTMRPMASSTVSTRGRHSREEALAELNHILQRLFQLHLIQSPLRRGVTYLLHLRSKLLERPSNLAPRLHVAPLEALLP